MFCFILIFLLLIVSCDRKPDERENVTSKSLNDNQGLSKVSNSLDTEKREQVNSESLKYCDPNLLMEGFKSQIVQEYTSVIYPSGKYWGTKVLMPPDEFSRVVKAGKVMVPSLIQLLTIGNENNRVAALMALIDITNNEFGRYEDFYFNNDESLKKRKRAIEQWEFWWNNNKNKSRVEWLLDDLKSNKGDHRIQNAIVELGILKERSAIPALRELLNDENLNMYAAEALAMLNDGYAIPCLIKKYLTDDTLRLRKQGIELLENLTSLTFDYDPNASERKRNKGIQKWEKWWEENKAQYQ